MVDWSTLWATVGAGIAVVFCVLLLLVVLVYVFSGVVSLFTNKKDSDKPQAQVTAEKKNPSVANATTENSIPGEVLAAITAAIAMMTADSGKKYTLKSVKRTSDSRSVWNLAGVTDNTRAF